MQVQVARWDNSLGLRIPKGIALRAGLREGTPVDVKADGDRIIISPARPRYVFADLLNSRLCSSRQGLTKPENWHSSRRRKTRRRHRALVKRFSAAG